MNRYILSLTETPTTLQIPAFRPCKILTNVTKCGEAFIKGIYINGKNQLIESQSIDAWLWSADHQSQLMAEFLAQHGLTGKNFDEIERYLDDNDLSFPDSNSIMLPSMKRGDTIHITMHGSCRVLLVGVS